MISSLLLLAWFVQYRVANARGSPNSEVLPSSKIGQALDMYQTDWESKYPATPSSVVLPSSKGISGLIERVPASPRPVSPPQPTSSPTAKAR